MASRERSLTATDELFAALVRSWELDGLAAQRIELVRDELSGHLVAVAAMEAVHEGAFGQMVALRAGQIVRVPLADAVAELKTVDPELLHGVAELFYR